MSDSAYLVKSHKSRIPSSMSGIFFSNISLRRGERALNVQTLLMPMQPRLSFQNSIHYAETPKTAKKRKPKEKDNNSETRVSCCHPCLCICHPFTRVIHCLFVISSDSRHFGGGVWLLVLLPLTALFFGEDLLHHSAEVMQPDILVYSIGQCRTISLTTPIA